MTAPGAWVDDASAALLTDLYELTMLQAYVEEGLTGEAVFDLFVRRLPGNRNYLVACGLDNVLHYLETVRFSPEALGYLRSLEQFSKGFVEWLEIFRFRGDVYAVPEGTPVFANEPIMQVVASLPEAQLIETFALNQIHLQTLMASKAARVVAAAGGRTVIDFGLRRMHGADAGLKAARAFSIVGVAATSNVLAGQVYGLPVVGTMGHSYVEVHDDELEALRAFGSVYPEAILLVDTYDTLEGVRKVIRLARELGDAFGARGVRLDSGDLAALSREARRMLDEAGLQRVEIFASGSLDENAIADLLAAGAPITGFGVGGRMGVSEDAPCLDTAYKLAAYDGKPRMKLSPDKANLPGRKQVFRVERAGEASHDVIGLHDEENEGRPLLEPVMKQGRRLEAGRRSLESIRARYREESAKLPGRLLGLDAADPPYRIDRSPGVEDEIDRLRRELEPAAGPGAEGRR